MDKTSKQFLIQAINFLEMATDQYGEMDYGLRERVREIVEELGSIVEG
jgi:hypothetical protein